MIYRVKVTPQVVDKFVFNRVKLIQRHPERSEGSPELDKTYLRFALDDVHGELRVKFYD